MDTHCCLAKHSTGPKEVHLEQAAPTAGLSIIYLLAWNQDQGLAFSPPTKKVEGSNKNLQILDP